MDGRRGCIFDTKQYKGQANDKDDDKVNLPHSSHLKIVLIRSGPGYYRKLESGEDFYLLKVFLTAESPSTVRHIPLHTAM